MFVFGKIGLLVSIFFLALLFPIGNFCFWACIFFFLDFRFINFFTDFRIRKILDLQIFVVISGY